MKNIFAISANDLVREPGNLKWFLTMLGHFFYYSFTKSLVVTDIRSFGDNAKIFEALDTIASAGRHYNGSFFGYSSDSVLKRELEKLDKVREFVYPNHRIAIVFQKLSMTGLGNMNAVRVDIRFMPNDVSVVFPERDFEVHNNDFNYPVKMDSDKSYLINYMTAHNVACMGKLEYKFGAGYLPPVFKSFSQESMMQYFGYLSLVGSSLTSGAFRFGDLISSMSAEQQRFFDFLSYHTLKVGLEQTKIVELEDKPLVKFASLSPIGAFGIKFNQDWFSDQGFPADLIVCADDGNYMEYRLVATEE